MSKLFGGLMNKLPPILGGKTEKVPGQSLKILEEIIKIDDKLILVPFPSPEKSDGLALYLSSKYGENFLVFNASEHLYDPQIFHNQVVDCTFPGYPCPPLEATFILLKQIDSWLASDPKHVAVINCQATRSRSFMLAAEYLCFCRTKYGHPLEGLNKICEMNGFDSEALLFPSQKIYLGYFGTIFNGFVPKHAPLILERVIINGIPNIEGIYEEKIGKGMCRPYIQLFQQGNLIFSSIDNNPIRELETKDLSCSFKVGIKIVDDVLLRCRHYRSETERVSMFRLFFHTSFVSQNFLRFTKEMLDGIQDNANYPSDFFIDLVFTEIKSEETNQKEKENKNKVWQIISQNCEEKRKLVEEETVGVANVETGKTALEEEKSAFVIDSPGLTPQAAVQVVEQLKDKGYSLDEEKETKKPEPPTATVLGELEKEAMRMHQELMEESKPVKSEAPKEEIVSVSEPKKVEEPPKEKVEEKTQEEDHELDSYLSSIKDLISK